MVTDFFSSAGAQDDSKPPPKTSEVPEGSSLRISRECAAVLLIGGGAAGATVAAAFVPTVLALVGFSGVGVTGGSYAASWQSSMGAVGIGHGTFFAKLQSIAMAGVGTKGIIGGVIVGGVMGRKFIHDICEKVDALGPGHWVVRVSMALIDKIRIRMRVSRHTHTCAGQCSRL